MGLAIITATGAAANQCNQLFKLRFNLAGLQYRRTQSPKGSQQFRPVSHGQHAIGHKAHTGFYHIQHRRKCRKLLSILLGNLTHGPAPLYRIGDF